MSPISPPCSLHALLIIRLVMPLKADGDLEILLLRFLGGGEDFANARAVHRDGLFHEDVFSLPHCLLEHHRAEARRGREDDHVRLRDGLLVGVEAEELVFRLHRELVLVLVERSKAAVHAVLMHVGDGHKFHIRPGLHGLVRRAGATSARADERDLDGVARRSTMDEALDGECAEGGGAGGELRGSREEVPQRDGVGRRRVVHVKSRTGWQTAGAGERLRVKTTDLH